MKLIALLLLSAIFQANANVSAQRVSLKLKDAGLQKVFAEIERQTGFQFLYNDEMLAGVGPVSVDLRNVSVEAALDECLRGKVLAYTISERTIVIRAAEPAVTIAPAVAILPEAVAISGEVLSPNGEPLAGATIKVKRTSIGTSTDALGRFSLVVNAGDVLAISYTGYMTQEIKIGKQHDLKIVLALADSKLDEVQIVAYGQSSQRYNAGNVTTVNAEDIAKVPSQSVLQALQGRVPGLFIQQNSGHAGANFSVMIQGQNSIQKGNNPFYVIDGVPYISDLISDNNYILGNGTPNSRGTGSPMTYVNPDDIESITVLKDADATAIYGARAANGAILITTKRGKAGPSKVDFSVRHGNKFVVPLGKVLNAHEYLEMRREAKKNDGTPIYNTDYDINGFWDTTRSTDWVKVMLGGHADYTEANGTVSGGTSNVRYLVGLTYAKERAVIPGNFFDQKGTLHFALNTSSADQRFKTEITSSYMYDVNRLPNSDQSGTATVRVPVAPKPYNDDGSINWAPDANGNTTYWTPLGDFQNIHTITGKHLNLSARFGYLLFKGFELATRLGYDNLQTVGVVLAPLSGVRPEDRPYSQRTSSFRTSNYELFNIEPQFNYNRVIGAGKLELTGGFTIQESNNRSNAIDGSGYTTDEAMSDISMASSIYIEGSTLNRYRTNGGFGRINYIHAKKYILSLTGRRDGSSRFGPSNRFHNFGSAAAGWIFSEESFFHAMNKVVSFGKLTASYGSTGNDQLGEYLYMNVYNPVSAARPYQNIVSLSPQVLYNPNLQWEETKKINVGLQLGFIKERFLLEMDYSRNRSGNQLLFSQLAGTTGFYAIYRNLPATVQNTALNVSATSVNIRKRDFSWTTRLVLTVPRNKLVRYDNIENTTDYMNLFVGKSISSRLVYHFLGVDPQTGLYTYSGHDGKPTSNPDWNLDRMDYVDLSPRYYGSIDNTLSYKGFSLSLYFMFVKQNGYDLTKGSSMPGRMWNEPTTVLGRWRQPGDQAVVQRYSVDNSAARTAFNALSSSTNNLRDASYARLKNITLSWTAPSQWVKAAKLRDAQLYLNMQNMFTWTGYTMGDPEAQSLDAMPLLKVVTVGVKFGL